MKTEKDLAEIYRRGRRTVNNISGRSEDEMVECKAQEELHTLERHRQGGPDERTDEYLYQELALIPFFAGMKAVIVEKYRKRINYWFGDYRKVAEYTDKQFEQIMSDPHMFHHEGKIRAAIVNAGEFKEVVRENGSFIQYIFKFNPHDSLDSLRDLMGDMQEHFSFFGPTVTKHYLMVIDIGLPLIKPDLHIMRTFNRIGLVDSDKDDEGTWAVAITMAKAANVSVLWVDAFVGLGLEDFHGPGSEVCGLEPTCNRKVNPCQIRELCDEWLRRNPEG